MLSVKVEDRAARTREMQDPETDTGQHCTTWSYLLTVIVVKVHTAFGESATSWRAR